MRVTFLAIALLAANPAAAQEAVPANLRSVFVLSNTADEVEGHLLLLDANTATLLVNGTRREFPLESVLRIETRGDSVRNGFLIGAAIGAVMGLLAAGGVDDGVAVPFVISSAGVWGLMGAGVDALIAGRTVLYRRPIPAAAAPRPSAALAVRLRF